MAVVDSQYRFVWASCGFPGNSQDAVIFKSTHLWARIEEGRGIPNIGQSVNGVTVPPLMVGTLPFLCALGSWSPIRMLCLLHNRETLIID